MARKLAADAAPNTPAVLSLAEKLILDGRLEELGFLVSFFAGFTREIDGGGDCVGDCARCADIGREVDVEDDGGAGAGLAIHSPCECEHNSPDSLDARLFPSVTPAVTIDEASSLSLATSGAGGVLRSDDTGGVRWTDGAAHPYACEWRAALSQLATRIDASMVEAYGAVFAPCRALRDALRGRKKRKHAGSGSMIY